MANVLVLILVEMSKRLLTPILRLVLVAVVLVRRLGTP